MLIETPRLTMRPFVEEDTVTAFEWLSDPRVMRYVDTPDLCVGDSRQRLRRYQWFQDTYGYSRWLICRDGEGIGDAGLFNFEDKDTVHLGYRLKPSCWGRGYATEACQAWVDAAFGPLHIDRLIAVTSKFNRASIRVVEKLGFQWLALSELLGDVGLVFERRRDG